MNLYDNQENMKKKIISTVVISTVAAGMLIGVVRADFSKLSLKERIEIETLIQKSKSGETLTNDEQKKLNEIKADFEGRKGKFMRGDIEKIKKGKGGIMKSLSHDEINSLKNMTNLEKKAFFNEKRELKKSEIKDKNVIKRGHQAVINKLINGESLNENEKIILDEIKIKRSERKKMMYYNGKNN